MCATHQPVNDVPETSINNDPIDDIDDVPATSINNDHFDDIDDETNPKNNISDDSDT